MKKVLSILITVFFIVVCAVPSFAGPSRALIQEMGSTIGAEEVNIDVDVVSHGLNVVSANDTTLGAGNATLGGTTVSSVNVGLAENYELRIGRLPGLRSYLTLPAVSAVALNPAPNNYGLTLKAGGFVPGLGVWLGYGSVNEKDIAKADSAADISGSSLRVGAAYTIASSLVYNVTLGYGTDSGSAAGKDLGGVSTLEFAAAALYPIRETLLVGAELHYATLSVGDDKAVAGDQKYDLTVLAPALGARAIAGNWTIDAVVALLSTSINVKGSPSLGSSLEDTASATVVGVPNLRINYKF